MAYAARRVSLGIGKETTRGTLVSASFWEKWATLKLDDKLQEVIDASAIGQIEAGENAFAVHKWSEGEVDANVKDKSFGLWLLALLGKDTPVAKAGGNSSVYDHTFSVLQSNQHQSLTLSIDDPVNDDYRYGNAMLDSLELDVEIGKLAAFKAAVKAQIGTRFTVAQTGTLNTTTAVTGLSDTTKYKVGSSVTGTNIPANTTVAAIVSGTAITLSQAATGSGSTSLTFGGILTPAYVSENYFLPQYGTFKDASLVSGIAAATAKKIKKFNIKIAKNLEADYVLGSLSPNDFFNKNFQVSGSIEAYYSNESDFKTNFIADGYRAILVDLVNSDVTIGASANPELQIQLARVKLTEVAQDRSLDGIVKQTVQFTGLWDATNAYILQVVLTNLQASY